MIYPIITVNSQSVSHWLENQTVQMPVFISN